MISATDPRSAYLAGRTINDDFLLLSVVVVMLLSSLVVLALVETGDDASKRVTGILVFLIMEKEGWQFPFLTDREKEEMVVVAVVHALHRCGNGNS
jgi:hypothetical protein